MPRTLISITLAILTCAAWAETDVRTVALDVNPGLTKPISLHVRGMSIREVLDKIEAETGVRLRPDRGIAEDKVSIWVDEQPARSVLRAIARCFDLSWIERDTGSGSYLSLVMDRDAQAALTRRDYDDYRAVLDRFDTELRATAEAVRMGAQYQALSFAETGSADSEEGLDQQRRRERLTKRAALSAMVLQYTKLSDIQKKALFEGQEVPVPRPAISTEAKDKYPEATGFSYWIGPSHRGYVLRGSVQPELSYDDWAVLATAFFDDSRFDKAIEAANETLTKDPALDRELPGSTEEEGQSGSAAKTIVSAEVEKAQPRSEVPRPGEGSGATPTTMSDFLLPIAEAAGIPVVAQYVSEYVGTTPPRSDAPAKASARLCGLSKAHRFTIERDGDFLLAKSVLWHRLRDREVPEANIRRWQRAFTGLPMPTFDALVEMASMTWGQVRGIMANSRYWFGSTNLDNVGDMEFPLALYASLDLSRQQALWQSLEIPVSQLRPAQQTLFIQAFEGRSQPGYVKAKDPSWPSTAAVFLAGQGLSEQTFFAMADMRGLGSVDMTSLVPEQVLPASSGDSSVEAEEAAMEEMDRRILVELPTLAKKAADTIAADNPEIAAKTTGIYAAYELLFRLRLGHESRSYILTYCVKVR